MSFSAYVAFGRWNVVFASNIIFRQTRKIYKSPKSGKFFITFQAFCNLLESRSTLVQNFE